MSRDKKTFIKSTIYVLSILTVLIVAYFVYMHILYRGKTIYFDSKIHTDEYDLSFTELTYLENGRPSVWADILVTNNTNTTKDFTIKNVSVKDDNKKIHNCKAVTLTIDAFSSDDYRYGYYCDNNNDISKYRLHFEINGDRYNLYFRNERY